MRRCWWRPNRHIVFWFGAGGLATLAAVYLISLRWIAGWCFGSNSGIYVCNGALCCFWGAGWAGHTMGFGRLYWEIQKWPIDLWFDGGILDHTLYVPLWALFVAFGSLTALAGFRSRRSAPANARRAAMI